MAGNISTSRRVAALVSAVVIDLRRVGRASQLARRLLTTVRQALLQERRGPSPALFQRSACVYALAKDPGSLALTQTYAIHGPQRVADALVLGSSIQLAQRGLAPVCTRHQQATNNG